MERIKEDASAKVEGIKLALDEEAVDTEKSIKTWVKEAKEDDESNIEVSARRIKALEKAIEHKEQEGIIHVTISYIYERGVGQQPGGLTTFRGRNVRIQFASGEYSLITESGALLDLQIQSPSDQISTSLLNNGNDSLNQPPNQLQKHKIDDLGRLNTKLEQMKMDKHTHMNALRELQRHN